VDANYREKEREIKKLLALCKLSWQGMKDMAQKDDVNMASP